MKKIKNTIYKIKKENADGQEKKELVLFCLSDLHGNEHGPENNLVIEYAKEQRPDLILAAGDMLSGEKEKSDAIAIALLSRLSQLAPVCYTDGNHEMQVKIYQPKRYERFMEGLQAAGVQVLHNRTAEFCLRGEKVAVTGYELPWEYYHRFSRKKLSEVQIKESIGQAKENRYQILLTHNPVFFDAYAKWGADLTFAGHLHGGFVRIPYLGGVISPQCQIFPKYDKGQYQIGKHTLIVGAGMGNHSKLFRINNPKEMILVQITR